MTTPLTRADLFRMKQTKYDDVLSGIREEVVRIATETAQSEYTFTYISDEILPFLKQMFPDSLIECKRKETDYDGYNSMLTYYVFTIDWSVVS